MAPAFIAAAGNVTNPGISEQELTAYRQAAACSRAHRGLSMVVVKAGRNGSG